MPHRTAPSPFSQAKRMWDVGSVANLPTAASQQCQTCRTTRALFTCVQCNNLAFCGPCWPEWVLHAPGQVGWGGKPHEKADPVVVDKFQAIFEPQRTESQLEADLLEDSDTTWFGVSCDHAGQPIFHDHGRFASIMADCERAGTPLRPSSNLHERAAAPKYPQLVSFIGETGAGKSTLIKLLIERQCLDLPHRDPDLDGGHNEASSKIYSPVSSAGHHDRVATTGDVHLYADPSTLSSHSPLLLADCEGFNGGEMPPRQVQVGDRCSPIPKSRPSRLSLRSRGSFNFSFDSEDKAVRSMPESAAARPASRGSAFQRPIAWAKTPQTKKREYAVAQLYPRILYAFSDVIVFVLRNPRAFESTVLAKLVNWGASSADKSINQPVLPRAIIVFNATESNQSLEPEWDVAAATRNLMADIHGAVQREPALREHVTAWEKRGKKVSSTAELLACYYSSVDVVRMPYKGGNYVLMDKQAGKLSSVIKTRCTESHQDKRQARMLANSTKLQVSLLGAYDHFTRDLNKPFDFVKEALRHSPVPRNFEGNVLNLAIAIKDRCLVPSICEDAQQIFLTMAPMIASCVIFDAVRQNLLGSAERLFDDRYAKGLVGALDRFDNMYWPCAYRQVDGIDSRVGEGDNARCCNVRSGHNPKGHQNRYGRIIGTGTYESSLDLEIFKPRMTSLIRTSLSKLQATACNLAQHPAFLDKTELQVVASLHRDRISTFYESLGHATDFISHSACLLCLRELPEYTLPCGHVLCLPCLEVYGLRTSRTTLEITSHCPLHMQDKALAIPPSVITTKPPHAGVRILSLDGGGVRGIVQLQVLKEIEKVLGPGLPLQAFFDLIVGSGTGAIIATALVVKKWSLDTVMEKFADVCKEAFTPRKSAKVPLVGTLSSLYHGSLCKNQPLAKTLQRHFASGGERPLFGGSSPLHHPTSTVKLAITSTSVPDEQAVIFTNYNRPNPAHALPYHFVRPDTPFTEMETWEAVHASVAAAPFFKPFLKSETGTEYIDMHNRCPVWVAYNEAKAIWGDGASSLPDVLLSIGTGRNMEDAEVVQSHRRTPSAVSRTSNSTALSRPSTAATGILSQLSSRTETGRSSISTGASIEDCQETVLRSGRGGAGNIKKKISPAHSYPTSPSSPCFTQSNFLSIDEGPEKPTHIRGGRGGAGNIKKTGTAARSPTNTRAPPSPCAPSTRVKGSGYFVRDRQTPLLVTFQAPQGGDYRNYDHNICEETWDDFVTFGPARPPSRELVTDDERGRRSRFLRICPEFASNRLPKVDSVDRMGSLEIQAKAILQRDQYASDINEIAHRLIASSFFFEKNPASIERTASDSYTCSGTIYCRFRQSSPELHALGRFLRGCLTQEFQPHFLIQEAQLIPSSIDETSEAIRWHPVRQILLTGKIIDWIQAQGYFRLDPIQIHAVEETSEISITLCLQQHMYPSGVTSLPISGFPRRLISEDQGR